jgi:aldehyde:ferredoxin oxidoreductase
MVIPTCYAGKLLFVDLNKSSIREETLSEQTYRDYIGGTGLGIRILYERMKPKADPLGPDNMLGFVTGPFVAAPVPGGGRYTVVTKSPTTGAWADSSSGGFWGPELKWAGYDALFISGKSSKPVYLLISGGKSELKDASKLWGKDTSDTETTLQKDLGEPKAVVSCIGPAGESLSLIAGIVNDGGRIAARGGVGAVMGSKKLKAVVIQNTQTKKKIAAADASKLKEAREAFLKSLNGSKFHQGITAAGTGGGNSFLVSIGDSPTKNWNLSGLDSMPTCTNLDAANMDKYKLDSYGCHACPVRCGALIKVEKGAFATKGEVHRPEYESIAALGNMCLNDNLESVIKANELCNLYGMDTMAVGGIIAFAMECYENGIITKKDTDGIELTWGNGAAVVALAEKIGKRQGFGEVLADGVAKAAERIGKGSEQYAMHVGRHRIPYHDPRNSPALGATFIYDAQPACHMESHGNRLLEAGVSLGPDPLLQSPKLEIYDDFDKKGPMFTIGAAYFQLLSSAGMCALYAIRLGIPAVELLVPLTGWNMDWNEGLKTGRRILTLRQAFNVREGITPDMFELPRRVTVPHKVGPATGAVIDYEALKKGYFEAMGWELKTGKIAAQTLAELGLKSLVNVE